MTTPPRFRERIEWDGARGEIRDGDIRYMMIRPDALMGMFTGLIEADRERALLALQASVLEHGGRSARTYRSRGADDAKRLLAVIEDTAAQLGWGIWTFQNTLPGSLTLAVDNSPFVAGFGVSAKPVCMPIVGMFEAVAALALGEPVTAREANCAAASGDACIFIAEQSS